MLPLAAVAIPLNNDTVSPGFLGFGVFIALAVVTFFLIRSMNKQIKKIQAPRRPTSSSRSGNEPKPPSPARSPPPPTRQGTRPTPDPASP
ncbi:hypothetical protein GEV43_07795 [Actinomadura sp. J1-007]|uniref:hypothetical protein n=1 Tax=Actinomadura sp. J1-007 TaxID=2661913 RepID=UPI0013288798|nr:hypothetical protein [Actinomadura sp. J1-007]MWK33946.1 hypothetical protein [Actinomadura sp. J1-007]